MSWKDKIRKVEPYVSGEQPKLEQMIKLNTNENPYPPSEKVRAVLQSVNADKLALYPNSDAETLRTALAEFWQFDESQIFIGNGSDEVLSLSFLTFFNSDKPVFMPDVTYPFYPTYCDLYGIKYVKQAVDADFHIQAKDYVAENGGIIFCNPCNPTGISEPLDLIEQILEQNQESVVIIDEAYADFSGQSAIPLLDKYENLLITRTFSKARSLAGIRLGVALGSSYAIGKLYDVKNSFNSYCVDMIAQEIGLASIQDTEQMLANVDKIIATRTWFSKAVEKLGFVSTDSQTNFVFIRCEQFSGQTLYDRMYNKHIIVRYWDKPGISDWVRITIGTDEQMKQVLEFLSKLMREA
ncbi:MULTISPECIES: histidinol-phosphate transaminase [unclassified Lactococcus]|uniref:histidinol-phosphate transaminase n=1 Tax=unclassified Lactococcus TaxID=2643510 RepID=UPI0011CA3648|nr:MULTISPECIES: histidinol-phosphate transaminase [unclassified Lactococcus]MQW22364.1 histidinol-phosphate transaminase [Lactococcus sp. dk101]TXK45401.1 histidinol-phosphate transaminase [Lactococcus sp. dk310]TXK51734.1 histidinol-phosphate transaminase [Lactococcus sp. dk322]